MAQRKPLTLVLEEMTAKNLPAHQFQFKCQSRPRIQYMSDIISDSILQRYHLSDSSALRPTQNCIERDCIFMRLLRDNALDFILLRTYHRS